MATNKLLTREDSAQQVVKTPAVTVDMAKFEKHKLPKFATAAARDKYIAGAPIDELVADVMLIGAQFKTFKDWFADHAEYVHELRDRLPARGPNAIEIRQGKKTRIYTWSEFCLEFFGVSADWVRKQLCLHEGMKADPQLEVASKPKSKDAPVEKADEMKVSRFSLETLEHRAQTYELRFAQAEMELRSLVQLIEKLDASYESGAPHDKVPTGLIDYVRDLEKRLALMAEPQEPAVGNNFKTAAAGEEL